mmetsp:Transcript_112821/g.329716  ORF Transcript_112821/g.329716 Transcript_112821/m.329716 type:complete len:232 (-) Transcript_112821:1914-2609(-)
MVTQPSLPSTLLLALMRVMFRTGSSCGPSTISSSSPTSSFRSAFPSAMSKVVVMAMLCLQISSVVSSKFNSPTESFKVAQPDLPSLAVLPLMRSVSKGGSFRGPSTTSKTSPSCSLRSSALPDTKSACRGKSSAQQKYGLLVFSRKSVPWFPRSVAQPSLPSVSARHLTRCRPVVSSSLAASKAWTTSPTCNFRTVLLSLTLKAVVMAISLTQRWYSSSSSEKVSFVTPPA